MLWHTGLGLIDAYDAAVVGRKADGRQPWSTPEMIQAEELKAGQKAIEDEVKAASM